MISTTSPPTTLWARPTRDALRSTLLGLRGGHAGGRVVARRRDLRSPVQQRPRRRAHVLAVPDRVGAAQHAQEGAAAAPVLAGAGDQAGDLPELHEDGARP